MKFITSMISACAGLAALATLAPGAIAQDTKAYDQLRDQLVGELEKFHENYSRANAGKEDCRVRCSMIAFETIEKANKLKKLRNAGEFVLSKAEEVVKAASAVTGVGGIYVSGYAMIKCRYDFPDDEQYYACLIQETVGFYAGNNLPSGVTSGSLQRVVDNLVGDLRQKGVARLSNNAKSEILKGSYELTQKSVSSNNCTSTVDIRWDPRPRAGYRGGVLTARVKSVNCDVSGQNGGRDAVQSFEMAGFFPLNLAPGKNREAGWKIDRSNSFIRFTFGCAGAKPFTSTVNMAGKRHRNSLPEVVKTEPKPPMPTPTPTPKPMTEEEKKAAEHAERLEGFMREDDYVCETCRPQEEGWNYANDARKRAEAELTAATQALNAARTALQSAQDEIGAAEQALADGAGETINISSTNANGQKIEIVDIQGADGRVTSATRVDGKITKSEDKGYAPGKEAAAKRLQAARDAVPRAKESLDRATQRRDAAKQARDRAAEQLAEAKKDLDACRERAKCEFGKR